MPCEREDPPVAPEYKRLGDRVIRVPVRAMWTRDDGTGPMVTVVFDVVDGTLQCREVTVWAREDGPELTRADLRAIPIGDLREQTAQIWSRPLEHTEGGATLRVDIEDEGGEDNPGWAARRQLAATRRRTDSATLERVAEVYKANPSAPTKAVQEAFGVAHRTAGLYVHRARQADLLPPAKRGKGGRSDG